jgi:maleate isomerase
MSDPYTREGSGYGWRARVGLVIPSIGITDACEFARIAPRGVISVDTLVRSEYDDSDVLTDEFVNSMVTNLSPAFGKLTDANVDVIAQCGTPFVFINGAGFGEDLKERLRTEAETPVVLMATAVRDALRRFDADDVALCTYYTDEFNQHYADYLEEFDFDVLGVGDMGDELIDVDSMADVSPLELAEIPLDATYRAARKTYEASPDADALVISGGNLPSIELIETLETDLGVPVTTSNQAAFWKALRVAGVGDELTDWGSLLRMDLGDIDT